MVVNFEVIVTAFSSSVLIAYVFLGLHDECVGRYRAGRAAASRLKTGAYLGFLTDELCIAAHNTQLQFCLDSTAAPSSVNGVVLYNCRVAALFAFLVILCLCVQ